MRSFEKFQFLRLPSHLIIITSRFKLNQSSDFLISCFTAKHHFSSNLITNFNISTIHFRPKNSSRKYFFKKPLGQIIHIRASEHSTQERTLAMSWSLIKKTYS